MAELMPLHSARVLIIDDNVDDRLLIERELHRSLPDVSLVSIGTEEEFEAAIATEFDAAITDYQLRFATGLEVFRRLRTASPRSPVIMFTATGSEEIAVEALKEGLADYITKTPKHYPKIPHALNAALEAARDRDQLLATRGALSAHADELAAIVSSTPAAIWVTYDAASSHVVGNAYAARLVGVPEAPDQSLEVAAGEALDRLVVLDKHGSQVPLEQFPVRRAARGEWVRDEEITLLFPDARRTTLLGNGQTLWDAANRPRGAVFAAIDVTARKEAENSLRDADRRKDEFLAVLAHELRNPMAPIRYCAAMLRQDVPRAVLEQARATIERQAAHLTRLLDDLLDISRITRNMIELQREPLNFGAVVQEAVEAASPGIARMKHEVNVTVPPDPLWVEADLTRLLQIIGNLLDNAIKYTSTGGRIALSVQEEAGCAVLRIADTGAGISKEMIPRVFELFTRADRARAGGMGGLGIGLALVQRLVELHGGSVEAHSEGVGLGAEFTIRLPSIASPEGVPANDAETVERLVAGRPRILVVDDHRDGADSLAVLLRNHGLEVHVAYDGESAVTLAARIEPSIVILDIGLPDISGEEVARRIRQHSWAARATLIAVSGWGQDKDRQLAQDAGVNAHLVKPVDPQELLRLISSACSEAGDSL